LLPVDEVRVNDSSKTKGPPVHADFAAMAENLPEMAWIANPRGRITWANRRWREYVGATPEQVGIEKWEAIHDPDYLKIVAARWQEALEVGEPVEMTFPLRGANGQFRMFLTRARPLRDADGKISNWFGINTDIGDFELAAAELKQQKLLLETLNRTAATVAAELNLEAMVQVVVDAGVHLTGAAFGAFFYNVTDESGESLTLYTISGVPRDAFSKFPMPRNTRVFAPTFHGEGIVRSDDITLDPRYGQNAPYKGMPEGHLPVRSYLAAPVVSRQGEVMGGLFFAHPEPARFTADHEAVLQGLASQAAAGVDNARLYESAQREIDERKQAEEARLVVLRELNHRVKNLFAITMGMVTMTARTAGTTERMADSLRGRLKALANAHELIRPSVTSLTQEPGHTTVAALAARILAAHVSDADAQLRIEGPDVSLGPTGATSLALVLHELATNAAKYGSLSDRNGRVEILWSIDAGVLVLTWTEKGGPAISGPPAKNGFGAELARMTAKGQLGGSFEQGWPAGGVEITLTATLERLNA
jgi:PAS domain S-box-containing protein